MSAAQAALPSTGAHPDPRTAVALLVAINYLALLTSSLIIVVACAVCVVAALLIARRLRTGLGFAVAFLVCAVAFAAPSIPPSNGVLVVLGILGFWVFRFSVVLGAGAYFVSVITPGELTAALSAARVPRAVRIPVVVIMRFFPLAREEFQAVRDAAALRGLPLGARAWLTQPLRSMEYMLVPLLASCSRIADDLTASGIVRGMESGVRPTSLVALRFSAADALALVVVAVLVGLSASGVDVVMI